MRHELTFNKKTQTNISIIFFIYSKLFKNMSPPNQLLGTDQVHSNSHKGHSESALIVNRGNATKSLHFKIELMKQVAG